ncbi:hypothetical protein SAMN05444266_10580 [Chitinophaga jiangningensis]|uniref:Uncharacterized protein n=1 Tax=Chitinophaga jiangningensis TaxID=1419482 RepID=A0A1M7DPR5_9BACT|nr:hypothetical protein [Chitinophaga jiangningensis]SHL81397.1 hypothetical protein SAMN05444266_10580 [Chitinophaga jiangningensis]
MNFTGYFYISLLPLLAYGYNQGAKQDVKATSVLPEFTTHLQNSAALSTGSPLDLRNRILLTVIDSDTMDFDSDATYGIGDDDAFTAEDFKVYKVFNGVSYEISDKLNDYYLTISISNRFSRRDIFLLVIYFLGLSNKMQRDTNIIARKLIVFNGNRRVMTIGKIKSNKSSAVT